MKARKVTHTDIEHALEKAIQKIENRIDQYVFIRYFLHFFHRHRQQFLEVYQELVLAKPESFVSQVLKEVF